MERLSGGIDTTGSCVNGGNADTRVRPGAVKRGGGRVDGRDGPKLVSRGVNRLKRAAEDAEMSSTSAVSASPHDLSPSIVSTVGVGSEPAGHRGPWPPHSNR